MNLERDAGVDSERLTRIENMLESLIDHFNVKPSRAAVVSDYYAAAAAQEALLIERGMSRKDAGARARIITDYLLHANGKVNPDSMAAYLAGLATDAQRNFALKALRPWARDALELGSWPDKFKFASATPAAPKVKSVSKDEVQDVSEHLASNGQGHAQAIWLALYWSGLRVDEVLNLPADRISLRTGALDASAMHSGRTKRAGVSFVPVQLAGVLARYKLACRAYTYKEFYDSVEHAKKGASVVGLTAKDLRRNFADAARSAGVPNDMIDALQGRAPKSVLAKHYTTTGQEALREYWELTFKALRFDKPNV